MIFVCVGSREYQFNRLLQKLDELVEMQKIDEEIFAQIGQSTYLPKFYNYKRFLSAEEFKQNQIRADLVISHGGTGALIGALKENKQVIAVPRLAKFHEHTDNHQLQVSKVLANEEYLAVVLNIDELYQTILDIRAHPYTKKYDRPSLVLDIIRDFINIE